MAKRKANEHGPRYDVTGAGLARWRKATRSGLASITLAERRAYGAAVEDTVLAMYAAAMPAGFVPSWERPEASEIREATSP
jgi:hypothetical protein